MSVAGAARRAQEHLDTLIAETPDGRLPPIGHMAQQAGVSHMTMWRAVDRLRRSGRLQVTRGVGIRVGVTHARPAPTPRNTLLSSVPIHSSATRHSSPVTRHSPPSSVPRMSWQRVADRLRVDIAGAAWGPAEPLPTSKELAARYGADYRTLRKALHELVAEKLVEPYGRGYRVPRLSRPATSGDIVLIAQGDRRRTLQFFSARAQPDLLTLSDLCAAHGTSLTVVPLARLSKGRPFSLRPDVKELQANRRALGYVVWSVGMFPETLASLLQLLHRSDKPVAVLDETGVSQNTPVTSSRIGYFIYGYGRSPGTVVGRYLRELGHRRVLYLSPFHRFPWSQSRLDALRGAYDAAGLAGCVADATDDSLTSMPAVDSTISREDAFLADVLERAGEQPGACTPAARAALNAMRVARIESLWGQAARIRVEQLLTPSLGHQRPTAVACANDSTAMHCLAALEQAGLRVPQDVSVIGFDDSLDALAHNLTSYNHNGRAVMQAMVQHVLHPRPVRGTVRQAFDVEGTVHERMTAARVP